MNIIQTKSFTLSLYSQGNPNFEKLALVLPGKLDSKDFAHMHAHVDFLASKGFFALSFDPPGTWESEGYGNVYTMTNYLKAVDEIIENYGNKKTFVVGHSRGGKIAMIAGSKNNSVVAYTSIMSWVAPKDQQKIDEEWKATGFHVTKRALPPGTGPQIKELTLPYSFHEDELGYFLTDEIKKCSKPKMLIYGKQDMTVVPEKVLQTYNSLSEPKEIHAVDFYHDYWHSPEIIKEINGLLENFIEKYHL